jgi:hypothetical protein
MTIKGRIKKLEQSSGVEQKQGYLLLTSGPEPTQEQIDDFLGKVKDSRPILAWTGERFVCTASEYLAARGYDVGDVDPEREIVFCHPREGVTI